MANLTTLRSTNGTGKQILCEEMLEFLGKTQNIHGQEFENLSKNETHICIIFNTVGCAQKQTCCFFHVSAIKIQVRRSLLPIIATCP